VPATDATPTDANVSESQPDVALADHGIPAPLPAPSRRESHEVAVAPDKLGTDASGPDRSAPAPKATTLVSADEEGAHLAPAARKTVSLGDLPETQSSADGQAPQKMERQNARSLSVFASLPGYTKEFASSAGLEISPAHISPSAGGKGQATREVENASAEPSAKPPSTDSPAPPGKTAATEPSAKPSNKDAPALHGEPAATEPSAKPPSSDPPAAPGEPTATEPSAKPASKDALLPDGQSASASPEASKTEPALSEPSRKVRKSV
ncbi:pol, partial [Symbiodinium sp. KB8]